MARHLEIGESVVFDGQVYQCVHLIPEHFENYQQYFRERCVLQRVHASGTVERVATTTRGLHFAPKENDDGNLCTGS